MWRTQKLSQTRELSHRYTHMKYHNEMGNRISFASVNTYTVYSWNAIPFKAKRQYLLTLQVSRYCLLALQSSIIDVGRGFPHILCFFETSKYSTLSELFLCCANVEDVSPIFKEQRLNVPFLLRSYKSIVILHSII